MTGGDGRLQGLLDDMARDATKCVEAVERASHELLFGDEQACCNELAWMDALDTLQEARNLCLERLRAKGIVPKVGD